MIPPPPPLPAQPPEGAWRQQPAGFEASASKATASMAAPYSAQPLAQSEPPPPSTHSSVGAVDGGIPGPPPAGPASNTLAADAGIPPPPVAPAQPTVAIPLPPVTPAQPTVAFSAEGAADVAT